MTFWDLNAAQGVYIKNPKFHDRGIQFLENFVALLERRDGKDWISIYHFPSINLLVSHNLNDLNDVDDISWNKYSGVIFAYESSCYNKVALIDPQIGLLKVFEPNDSTMGIKSTSFKNRFFYAGL